MEPMPEWEFKRRMISILEGDPNCNLESDETNLMIHEEYRKYEVSGILPTLISDDRSEKDGPITKVLKASSLALRAEGCGKAEDAVFEALVEAHKALQIANASYEAAKDAEAAARAAGL